MSRMQAIKETMKNMASAGAAVTEMVISDVVSNIRYGLEQAEGSQCKAFGNLEDISVRHGEGFVIDGVNALDCKKVANLAVFAGTGVGKTSASLIPTLLYTSNGSYIVHDSSRTVFPIVAPRLAAQGVEIHRLNYSDVLNSSSINLMDFVSNDEESGVLSHHLIDTRLGGSKADLFFNNAAEGVVSWSIRLCKLMPVCYRHLGNVKHIIQALTTKGTLDKVAAKYSTPKLWNEYKQYRNNSSEKTMSSIIMSALVALEPFSSDALCRASVTSSVNFASFRERRQLFIIETPTYESSYFSDLTSIVVESALRVLMKHVPEGGLPCYMLLDECSTLNLKSLSQCVSNSRKTNIRNLIFYQSPGQLIDTYGMQIARNILLNCSHGYYGHMDLPTSQEISALCGRKSISGRDGKIRSECLIRPDEITRMPRDRGLLLHRNIPYKLHLQRWFTNPLLRLRAKGEPYVFSNPHIPGKVDLIPFS